MMKNKFCIAFFMLILVISLPVNASISFNHDAEIYSTQTLNKEKIIPYKLENFEVLTQLNEKINLDYNIAVQVEKFIINSSINLDNTSLRWDNISKIRLNNNLNLIRSEMQLNNLSLTMPQAYNAAKANILASTETNYGSGCQIVTEESSGVAPLVSVHREPRVQMPIFGLLNYITPLGDCTENGEWCSCEYGCSTYDCCSGTCEDYTCLDYTCYPDWPNLCDGGCYSACSTEFICDSTYGGVCCPESYPYWCPDSGECWDTPYLPNPCGSGCPSGQTECNGRCYYDCSSGTTLCCPSSGAPDTLNCCGSNQICQSDGTCLTPECDGDSDCSSDGYYCSGEDIMFRDYYCSNYQCSYDDSLYFDCNDNNHWYCLDSDTRAYADYYCAIEGSTITCHYTPTNQQDCAYACSNGNCVTTTIVHGYMKYSDGSGIPDVNFKLENCDTGSTIASDYTDSSGYYSIDADAGDYVLSADYLSLDIDFTSCTDFYGDVSVPDITLGASLSGYVKYSSGSGRSGVIVRLKDCSDNVVDSATTDSNGYYDLSASDAGYYKVTMELYDLEFDIFPCQAMLLTMTAPDVVFNAHLSGYIQDSSGNSKPNIPVRLADCSGAIIDTATTDSNGYFKVESADTGYFDFYFTYLSKEIQLLDCRLIVGNAQFLEPIVLSTTLHGYLKDLDDNPLEDYAIELYDCSENFIASTQTSSTGYFSITQDAANYKIMIDIGGWKLKLVDKDENDCFFLLGDINVGTLNINPTADCSIFDYMCYQDDIKLFNCYWNEEERGCYCYGTQCSYGCTNGLEECDSGQYGTIVVDVDDKFGYASMPGAKIYLDDNYKGVTDFIGKKNLDALYGYRSVKVNCPDGSYCSSKEVYVDSDYEYVYFDCDCGTQTGDVNLFVYNVNGYPLVNVIIYLAGDEKGYTNPFGQIYLEDVSYGNHNLKLEVYVSKEPPYRGVLEQNLLVDSENKVKEITLREEDLTKYDFQLLYEEDGYTPQVIPLVAVMAVVDIASVTYSATELCKCVYKTDKLVGGAAECFDTLNKCSLSGLNVNECIQGVQEFGSISDDCFWETAFLVGDAASPLIPAGIVGHFIVKVGTKFSWVDNAIRFFGKAKNGLWEYTKKLGDYVVSFFAKNTDQGIKKAVKLGTYNLIEWGDEALQGLEKIISKGGQKSGHGLIRYLGEEGAEKLSKNIDSLSKKGIKGFDRPAGQGLPNGLVDEISDAAKDYEEKVVREGIDSDAAKGARGRLKGAIFEAEVAANPGYLDNVAELRKPLTKSDGELDILLKNGDILEVKDWTFPITPSMKDDLIKQIRRIKSEYSSNKLTILFRNPPDTSTKVIIEDLLKIGWEVLE